MESQNGRGRGRPQGVCSGAPDSTCLLILAPTAPRPPCPPGLGVQRQQAGGWASGQPLCKKEGRGGRVEMTVYSLVTKRGCGGHQHVRRVSRPAGPHRHWPPTLGSRAVGDSCRHPVALVGGDLGCCWQWEPGGEGPGPSRAPEACARTPGCPPEGPCRLFCPCPPACTPGPAGQRGAARQIPLLARGLGHWGARPQLPRGCLCP